MKTRLMMVLFLLFALFSFAFAQKSKAPGAHIPAMGSAERQAILDALRGGQEIKFKVHYMKVHGDWGWVDTTPLDKSGQATAEGGPNLMHRENGKWKVMDLATVPEDPNDPLGAEDASPTYVRNVIKTFPGVPRDIFPKPGR